MLPEEITQLLTEAKKLGNHYHKNIQNIVNIYPALHRDLAGISRTLDLNPASPGPPYHREMRSILQLSASPRTRLNYLGCYCSVQLLRFNLFYLNWLEHNLSDRKNRTAVFRRFMLKSGWQFRKLTAAYMQHLMILLKEDKSIPRFVIAGVGTRSDQDDIDVGIIDDGQEDRIWLNQVIERMSMEMIRFITNFHFHLSEHVGTQVYSASIPEYRELLSRKIGNFVILTEMLGAAFIIGDNQLFTSFQKEITDRYYYTGRPNRYHEGYLRGILGEVVDLHTRTISRDHLHPKFDGLRITKNIIYAYKTRFGIQEVNPWKILQVLKKTSPEYLKEFQILEKSLSFLEIFRYLYQQMVVQEEYIPIQDGAIIDNLQWVASTLNYHDFGPHAAVHHLLHDYRRAVQDIRKVVPALLEDMSVHLQRVTVFRGVIKNVTDRDSPFPDFFRNLYFFDPVQYWDDLFQLISHKPEGVNELLLKNLVGMPPRQWRELLIPVMRWMGNNPEFLFKFCFTFEENLSGANHRVLNQMIGDYLNHYQKDFGLIVNMVALYRREPSLLCKILQLLVADNLLKLKQIIYQTTYRGENALYQKNLAELVDLMYSCSHYFKRVIQNIYHGFPDYTCFIHEPDLIRKECEQILRKLPFIHHTALQKQAINNYYDLKFFHVGLDTFKGMSIQNINDNFTSFVSIYFRELYQICLRQVMKSSRDVRRVEKCLAIYACGGNGRGQAFDDDFDLIIIADCQEATDKDVFREIISLMVTEMIKRGTLPHFRFSQHFGEYMCPYGDLKELLASSYPEIYIDKSQLLESRILHGSKSLHKRFLADIIRGLIFANGREYISQMMGEIKARHARVPGFQEHCANIKECTGGLRDIEMAVLIYKVLYQLLDTDTYGLIRKYNDIDKKLGKYWKTLESALIFLQKFRYLYRLTVAAEDEISDTGLEHTAIKFNPAIPDGKDPSQWLWENFSHHRRESWGAVGVLLESVG